LDDFGARVLKPKPVVKGWLAGVRKWAGVGGRREAQVKLSRVEEEEFG